MKILIINGPNLNLLGKREPGIYGSQDMESFLGTLRASYPEVTIDHFQSNVEGELINCLHDADAKKEIQGILMNAGGYTHTSVAIADAIAAISVPVVEIHISNVYKREEIRHHSLMAANCVGVISGFGLKSYELGILYFKGIC